MTRLAPPRLTPPRLTTALGGCGIVLASLYPLLGVLASFTSSVTFEVLPPFVFSNEFVLLASWLVLALAAGVLAFGVPGERDVVGGSTLGRVSLFVFGVHHLVLGLAGVVSPAPSSAGDVVGGWVTLALSIVGWAASAVAAVVIVRARVLHGPARWALVVLAVVDAAGIAMTFVLWAVLSVTPSVVEPAEQGLIEAAFALSALGVAALAGAGAAFALFGRSAAVRRRLQQINAKW